MESDVSPEWKRKQPTWSFKLMLRCKKFSAVGEQT
jgi:hypothetical protein